MNKGSCFRLAALAAVLWLAQFRVEGVVVFGTGDPHHNTKAPTGALAGSGWELQGDAFPGIPIAPNYFITATHVGGKAGDVFSLRGQPYTMTAAFRHPQADITIWRVNGTFPQYAQIYNSSDEVGKPFVVFGRGCVRGEEIRLNGALKGWAWGRTDGLLRWGQNTVAGISDPEGRPVTSSSKAQLLRADFDAHGGPNEAHLAGGDSGGGVFIRQNGVWKLAGVNSAANKDYSHTASGEALNATLFDESGLFEGEKGKREYRYPDDLGPQPGSFYATRLSAYLGWIQGVISHGSNPQQPSGISLHEASSLLGPYNPLTPVAIDTLLKTVTINRPAGTRFYRVSSDRPHTIKSTERHGNYLILTYE